MSRRRPSRSELTTIYWRDIPAQVNLGQGRDKQQAILEPRFQHAIDRAAGVAGLTDTDSYVAQWRRETTSATGDIDTAAHTEAERLDAEYPTDRLEMLVAAGGVDDTTKPANAAGVPDPKPDSDAVHTEVDQ